MFSSKKNEVPNEVSEHGLVLSLRISDSSMVRLIFVFTTIVGISSGLNSIVPNNQPMNMNQTSPPIPAHTEEEPITPSLPKEVVPEFECLPFLHQTHPEIADTLLLV